MLYSLVRTVTLTMIWIKIRDAEAEPEARKFYRFRFHIGGKNGRRKGIGSVILQRKANKGSINIKK